MTTATILSNEALLSQRQRNRKTWSEQEESYNDYWAEYFMQQGFNLTCLPVSPATVFQQAQSTIGSEEKSIAKILQLAVTEPKISQKNLEAIKFLDQWMAEPDDLGETFWKEFCDDLEKNRFTI